VTSLEKLKGKNARSYCHLKVIPEEITGENICDLRSHKDLLNGTHKRRNQERKNIYKMNHTKQNKAIKIKTFALQKMMLRK
jgi:hypothetical protein